MEKMTGKSMDLLAGNIALLKKLFPEAVSEGRIDFDVLKTLLGSEIVTMPGHYKFTWNGKEEARIYARIPSMGTLRPCEAESSGKDGTPGKFDSSNLYIEGDNLEVLKLLQGPYHKRVKLIYIDPPYNTGRDFVYPDNFRNSIRNYKTLTGQADETGASCHANPETSGRYHTDWLNMMYPRMILARNLLTDDGALFVSIDDSESDNLKKLCCEVFGEENFLAQLVWKKKYTGGKGTSTFADYHEYILAFAKNIDCLDEFGMARPDDEKDKFTREDEFVNERGRYYTRPLKSNLDYRPTLVYPIQLPDGTEVTTQWICAKETFEQLKKDGRIEFKDSGSSKWPVYKKFYENDSGGEIKIPSFIECSSNNDAKEELKELFNIQQTRDLPFQTPKPTALLNLFSDNFCKNDDIVLDFFSGSASMAHSVMLSNLKDSGCRKFIMVQLPEICKEGTAAAKEGFRNICEIGKERIRRAAKKIKSENLQFAGDMGFKVFKLDTSNLVPWNPDADKLREDLLAAADNVLAGRSTQDLLYEILLKCNLPLTLPVAEKKSGENTIYIAGNGALALCLDKVIPQTVADEIVKLRNEYAPVVPMQAVFRDNGLTDVVKANILQILKQAGFEESSVRTI